jgi:ABC-type glycerol-3-phosphate transport system substrate-binding protein
MHIGIYITVGILLVVIIFLIIRFNTSENFGTTSTVVSPASSTSSSSTSSTSSVTNGIKYFGGSYCPHSRVGSRAYTLIKDFEAKYPNIKVEYYWTGEDNEEFTKANAEYVPTVTDTNYNKINLTLPNGVNTNDKTDVELKNLVLLNIHHQL